LCSKKGRRLASSGRRAEQGDTNRASLWGE
jgi:hypothetical protein